MRWKEALTVGVAPPVILVEIQNFAGRIDGGQPPFIDPNPYRASVLDELFCCQSCLVMARRTMHLLPKESL